MLAGAGTGKTRTLTAGVALRIVELGIAPSRILCVTFTNKAAAEMKQRIAEVLIGSPVPSWVGTFHGLGARQLRAEPEIGQLRAGFDILDADDSKRIVKRIIKTMSPRDLEEGGPDERDPVKMICGLIGKLKDRLVPPDEAIAYVERLIAVERNRKAPVRRARSPPRGRGLCRISAAVAGGQQRRFRRSIAVACSDHAARQDLSAAMGRQVRLCARR